MTTPRDYYEVLGVPPDADARTVKNAFRRLARRYHPDASAEPDAEERFKEIAEAYGVLSDPGKRARYDSLGVAGLAGTTAEDLWGGIDFAGIFGAGAPGFGGLFDRLFGAGAGAGARPGPPRGGDVEVAVTIPLRQVLTGGQAVITISRPGRCQSCAGSGARRGTMPRTCPACAGAGQLSAASQHGAVLVHRLSTCQACQGHGQIIDDPCQDCRGTGQAVQHADVTIRIPAGIPEHAALRLPGRGLPSPAPGGPAGDAYVLVGTEPDPRFARDGADLWHTLHLRIPDAVLGATVDVPTLGRPARVRIPARTAPGTVIPLAGKGLPYPHGNGRGDLNVSVVVDMPGQLSPAQRQLYEQLRHEEPLRDEQEPRRKEPRRKEPRGWRRWHRRRTPGEAAPRDPGQP